MMKRTRNLGSVAHTCCRLPVEVAEVVLLFRATGSSGTENLTPGRPLWWKIVAARIVEISRSLLHLAVLRLKIRSNVMAAAAFEDGRDVHHTPAAVPVLGLLALLLGYLKKLQV